MAQIEASESGSCWTIPESEADRLFQRSARRWLISRLRGGIRVASQESEHQLHVASTSGQESATLDKPGAFQEVKVKRLDETRR